MNVDVEISGEKVTSTDLYIHIHFVCKYFLLHVFYYMLCTCIALTDQVLCEWNLVPFVGSG